MSSNLADLSISLLSVLQCPVCLVYMVQPIRQCKNGHNICGQCFTKLTTCPSCRSEFIETRNYPLEKIASQMEFPCEFKDLGCTVALKFDDLKEHAKRCKFGNLRCGVRLCKWKGPVTTLMDHMTSIHPEHIMQKDADYHFTHINWDWLTSKKTGWMVYILKGLGELFWVHVKQESTNEKVMVIVQHVTTTQNDDKFLYEVKLEGQAATSVYRAPTVPDTAKINALFVAERCFCITTRALKQFTMQDDDDVVLKVKVERYEKFS